jgi:phage/plasmid-like protein (TIGR03299 family)
MSQETLEHLNTNTLIGFTDRRGRNAWHYRADLQQPWEITLPDGRQLIGVGNHYAGAIPAEHVKARLFNWQATPRRVAVEFPATFETMTHLGEDGQPLRWAVQEDRQAIAPDDADLVLGFFKSGYRIHQYDRWLLDNTDALLSNGLAISSAGLLRNRAQAWLEASVPDTFTTPEGVEFRPNLLAATSLDGSIATTYARCVQLVVCDNTRDYALREKGQKTKIRHSSGSLSEATLARARAELNLAAIEQVTAAFTAQVAREAATPVTGRQFGAVLELLVPVDPESSKRSQTMAENKREQITQLYRVDPRVAPWKDTAFGVLQAFNTWSHHEQGGLPGTTETEKRAARADRNAWRAISGETGSEDGKVADALRLVLA